MWLWCGGHTDVASNIAFFCHYFWRRKHSFFSSCFWNMLTSEFCCVYLVDPESTGILCRVWHFWFRNRFQNQNVKVKSVTFLVSIPVSKLKCHSVPGATTFPLEPPQKNSVSELGVFFWGSPLFLAVLGLCYDRGIGTLNFVPISTKLGVTVQAIKKWPKRTFYVQPKSGFCSKNGF